MKVNLIALFTILLIASCAKEDTNIDNSPEEDIKVETFTALKSGIFVTMSGYITKGGVDLGKDSDNKFYIKTKSDFSTIFSTGSVTFYLSKNPKLALSDASSFIQLGVITKNGEHLMEISGGQPSEFFKYVIVWCSPARIQFGSAELK